MVIHPIKIDVTPKNSSYIRIFVSQNDCKSRIIEAQIYSENDMLSDLNAPCKIYYSGSACKKVEPFYQEAEIVNGVCRFTVPQSVLVIERELFVEIQIGSSEDTSYQLTTEKFLLKVKGQIGTTDSVLGSDEGNLIELYVNTAKENADKTEKIAADIQQLSENIKENTQSAVNEAISNMSIYSKQEVDNLIDNIPIIDSYTKEEIDNIIDEISIVDTYTKSEIDSQMDEKADRTTTYTKEEVNTIIDGLDITESYSKDEIDNKLSSKANSSSVYTKSQVDTAISDMLTNTVAQDTYLSIEDAVRDYVTKAEYTELLTSLETALAQI